MKKSAKSVHKDTAFSKEYNNIMRIPRYAPSNQQWKKAGDHIQKFSLHKRYPTSTSSNTTASLD